jgi:hypothetical protein
MKYQANPVIVDAFVIREIRQRDAAANSFDLTVGDDHSEREVTATPEMCSRMWPKLGDYWVIQADGYAYLNPKDVFERKYSPVEPNALELGAMVRAAGLQGE